MVDSVTKKLQDDSLTLSDSRALLNGLLSKYPTMRSHTRRLCSKMAVVRANDGAHTEADQTLLRNLDLIKNDNLSEDRASTSTSFADSLLEAKRQKLSKGPTCYLEWIKTTSNIVERLNSRAKLVFETSRHRLSPGSLEENLFLYVNKRFWDISVVDKIIMFNSQC